MNDAASIAAGLAAGLLLGALFFGGLWWTIRRGLASGQAPLWFAASYLARFAILAGGLYAVAHNDAARGVAACVGVVVARIAVALLTRGNPPGEAIGGKPR